MWLSFGHSVAEYFRIDYSSNKNYRLNSAISKGIFSKSLTVWNSSEFPLNDEGRDLVGLDAGLRILDRSLSKDGEDLGDATVGDPDLRSVEHPSFSVWSEFRPSFDRSGVRSGRGFGQGKGGKLLAWSQRGEVLGLLLRCAQKCDA